MKNATIELIHKHGSVRNYKRNPIPVDVIETIVGAGQRAATSSNLQMFSVVVTTDQEERDKMRSYCGGQSHISQAPVFMTWCADLSRLDRICRNLGYSHQAGYVENFLLAVVDAAIASQNAALAAESLGLGFCYIGAIRNSPKEVISMLKLPKLVFPLVGMTIGYPVEPPSIRPRLPLNEILHWGRYDTTNEEAYLQVYDQEMIETGIYGGRQVSAESPISASEYGWLEHSARRVSQVLRDHLREVLYEQGFELN